MKSYSKILVLGNGFDINLGLETSYTDFVKSDNFINLHNNYLANFLKSKHNLKNWIDIECELEIYSQLLNPDSNQYNKYESNFRELSAALNSYISNLNNDGISKDSLAYQLLKEIVKSDNYLILDFNYTSSTERLLYDIGVSSEGVKEKLIKVHGTVVGSDTIFGVEDDAEIKDEHVFLLKSFNKNYNSFDFSKWLNNSNEVHIFGHSLGKTDHQYFKSFFNILSRENYTGDKKKILLHHYGEDSYTDIMRQIRTLTYRRLAIFKRNCDFIPLNTKV